MTAGRLLPLIAGLLAIAGVAAAADGPVRLGTFVGKLPCADCSGIEQTLTLQGASATATSGTYRLRYDYLGKTVAPYLTRGAWRTERGSARDPDATVYRLDPDGAAAQYFLAVGDDALRPLDTAGNEIDAPIDMTLRRQAAGLANPASVNCIDQGGTLEIRHDAAGGAYGVCRFADGRQCEEWALFRDKKCLPPAP